MDDAEDGDLTPNTNTDISSAKSPARISAETSGDNGAVVAAENLIVCSMSEETELSCLTKQQSSNVNVVVKSVNSKTIPSMNETICTNIPSESNTNCSIIVNSTNNIPSNEQTTISYEPSSSEIIGTNPSNVTLDTVVNIPSKEGTDSTESLTISGEQSSLALSDNALVPPITNIPSETTSNGVETQDPTPPSGGPCSPDELTSNESAIPVKQLSPPFSPMNGGINNLPLETIDASKSHSTLNDDDSEACIVQNIDDPTPISHSPNQADIEAMSEDDSSRQKAESVSDGVCNNSAVESQSCNKPSSSEHSSNAGHSLENDQHLQPLAPTINREVNPPQPMDEDVNEPLKAVGSCVKEVVVADLPESVRHISTAGRSATSVVSHNATTTTTPAMVSSSSMFRGGLLLSNRQNRQQHPIVATTVATTTTPPPLVRHQQPQHQQQQLVVDEGVVVGHNNVISIPETAGDHLTSLVLGSNSVGGLETLKLENGGRIQITSAQQQQQFIIPSQITLPSGNTILINNQGGNNSNILAEAIAGNITGREILPSTTTMSAGHRVITQPLMATSALGGGMIKVNSPSVSMAMPAAHVKMEPSTVISSTALSMPSKPPSTDVLLKTAKEVLQLPDEPAPLECRRIFAGGMIQNVMVDNAGNILGTTPEQPEMSITDEVSQMEVTDENGTYILESVNGEELYEDPNIMWIEETVEVEQESYDNLPNMVIILNPNGTVNEELMLANGMNMETIKAVTDAATGGLNLQTVIPTTTSSTTTNSITSLQHPIPKKQLTGIQPLVSTAPRTIVESAAPITQQVNKTMETQRSVILHPKDDYLVLDDIKDPMLTSMGGVNNKQQMSRIININGTQHLITSPKPIPELRKINNVQNLLTNGLNVTPLGTLDLSLPKKVEPGTLEDFVNPSVLVTENTVLKALDQSDPLKLKRNAGGGAITKQRRPRMRDENGNGGSPYIHRKTTSLGALGQALHGMPRDCRENAVQICPICKFQATTKNPYRHLQDHLARVHFKDRIAAELPTKKPYICPFDGCDGKQYPDWQAVMRHYIGKKHGILDKYVKEELVHIRRENGGRIPGTVIRPGVEILI